MEPGSDRPVTDEEMRKALAGLRIEHRDLDAAIDALTGAEDEPEPAPLENPEESA